MNLTTLSTPCLLLEKDVMKNNMAIISEHVASLGARFRPHLKTSKSLDVLNVLQQYPMQGITVSTLREAEYFFSGGVNDILYAVSLTSNKFKRAIELVQAGCQLTCLVEDVSVVKALADYCQQARLHKPLDVMIEIDVDAHRAGVQFDDKASLIALANAIELTPALSLKGVLTHAGESYHCDSIDAIRHHAELEQTRLVQSKNILCDSGFSCPETSMGSTPTARFSQSLQGISEVRAGVFVFYDVMMQALGVCDANDIALTVLSTVMAHNRKHKWILVDAGGLALSKEHSEIGYGKVLDINGQSIDGLCISRTNQEHGVIEIQDDALFDRLAIGQPVRIAPVHACMTAAAYDSYHVIRNNLLTNEIWQRCNGW